MYSSSSIILSNGCFIRVLNNFVAHGLYYTPNVLKGCAFINVQVQFTFVVALLKSIQADVFYPLVLCVKGR